MKALKLMAAIFMFSLVLAGCSSTPKSPDVSDSVRKSLEQAGYRDVSVTQDREKASSR